jgi:hypothetical protein
VVLDSREVSAVSRGRLHVWIMVFYVGDNVRSVTSNILKRAQVDVMLSSQGGFVAMVNFCGAKGFEQSLMKERPCACVFRERDAMQGVLINKPWQPTCLVLIPLYVFCLRL